MKTLIIYFSYGRNTARIADMLKSGLDAQTLEIKYLKEKKRRGAGKFIWALFQMFHNRKPKIKPYEVDINAWDLIILGTPVWGSGPSPVMRSFLDQTKISGKKIALFCTHAGSMGNCNDQLEAMLPGNTVLGKTDFLFKKGCDPEQLKQKADEWIREIAEAGK